MMASGMAIDSNIGLCQKYQVEKIRAMAAI
jgi:hypothetical protein